MNTGKYNPPVWLRLAGIFLLLLTNVFAQAGTGRIEGRIFNPAKGEYVRNAEIREQGSNRITYSEEGGRYVLDNVTAGTPTIVVNYTGYQTVTAAVPVTAGATATRDFELVSAQGAGDTVQMAKFVVSNEREGNAKALMEQRRSMNITTSVASDIFGDVTEGNVGEFLKFLPGVDVDYVDGVARGPRIGGLDPQYVGVTMDGSSLASADAFISYSNTLNGGAGDASRSVGFEQMSITSIDSIEVNRTLSADMDASSPAGTINMKSRRAFDRKGRRIDWQFSLNANSDAFTFEKSYGPNDDKHYQIRPNFQIDYSDVFLNQRLGIRFGISQSSVVLQQQYVIHAYNKTQVTTGVLQDRRPMVLTGVTFLDGPKMTDRFNATLTADFKATQGLVFSLTTMFNTFENQGHTKNLIFNAAANGVAVATGRQNVGGDGMTVLRTNGLANNTSRNVNHGGGSAIKLTNTFTVTPKFEYKVGSLTLDGVFNYSRSINDYETTPRGTIRVETFNPLQVDFVATRSNPLSAEWKIVQTSGPDWSKLENYVNPRIGEEDRGAFTEIIAGEFNARYVLPFTLPTFVKIGGKATEENRESYNRVPYQTFSYIGPGGGPTGNFAAYPSPRGFNTQFGEIRALDVANLPVLANRSELARLYQAHPEWFVNSATAENYYTAYIANERVFGQFVPAAYGMANTRVGRFRLQGGLRWERTETEVVDFDPLTATEVQRAGYAITTATRRATTVEGLQYQYFTKPKVTRRGQYDDFFPSASLVYNFRPNLVGRLGYSYAISRPPIDALAGVWSINEVARVITSPNSELKPERSHNFVGRLEYAIEPAGNFSVTLQQVEITDQRLRLLVDASETPYGNDPDYGDYEFSTWVNRGELYRYRSFEVAYSQQFTMLPDILRGTSINASYTRNYANQYFQGVTPHKFSTTLGWAYRRFNIRFSGIWMDDTPMTTLFGRYQRNNFKLDVSGGLRLTKRTSLFFQGRNVFNDPQQLMEGEPNLGIPAALYRYGNYGASWTLGVKGNF
ncbi:MAG: TonB-dependent receptor [Verrucomicrobiota bacterium]